MKILHLMLACFYIDNYSYQENYLPKYHKAQGHDVQIVASLYTFDENGKGKRLPKAVRYENEHGIPVSRLELKKGKLAARLRKYVGLKEELERFAPELIFIHGVQFGDISVVAEYCKANPDVQVYADNHSDLSNSAKSWVSRHILHRVIWRRCAHRIEPYTRKFYGVLPARVDFLIREYKLPEEKVALLVMGADDQEVDRALRPEVRRDLREQYGLTDGDTVIVTGGKIDRNKPQTLLLMEGVNGLKRDEIKLLVFGSVIPELKKEFEAQLSNRVQYIGWKQAQQIYDVFSAADLIAFPGLHSVLWEQAVAMGKPCVFRKLPGFSHIDLGGNCTFFETDTPQAYGAVIEKTLGNLESMRAVAAEKGRQTFSYSRIAARSIAGGIDNVTL